MNVSCTSSRSRAVALTIACVYLYIYMYTYTYLCMYICAYICIYVWHARVRRGYVQVCMCKLRVPDSDMFKHTYTQVTHMHLYMCVLRDLSCWHLRVSDALLSIASRLLRSLVTDPSNTTPTNLIQCRYSAPFMYVWPSLSLYRIMFIGKAVFICLVVSVNSVLKFLGQPGETRFQAGGDKISSGVPMTFNTKLTEPKGK